MGAVNVIVLLFISRHEDRNVLLDGKVIRNVFTEERHTKIQTWTRVGVPSEIRCFNSSCGSESSFAKAAKITLVLRTSNFKQNASDTNTGVEFVRCEGGGFGTTKLVNCGNCRIKFLNSVGSSKCRHKLCQ